MKNIISLFSLLILSATSFFLLFSLNKTKNQNQTGSINQIITKANPVGKIYLQIEEKELFLNQPFKLLVFADSSDEPITGFDVVLTYDPKKLEFKNLNSLIPEYQIFKKVEGNEIRITAIKPLEVKTLTIFKNTPLMEIFFSPQRPGETEVNLEFSPNAKNESNLINNQTEDILSQVEGVKLNIK